MAEAMRLDKLLSDAGIGTRSQVRKLVKTGCVSVDGIVAKDSSMHINPFKQIILLNGQKINYEEHRYFMMNKPKGYISATRDSGPVVLDLMHENTKNLFPVGRLDKDTTGLLLITDDGPLGHDLLSPRHHVDKTYEVITRDPISEEAVKAFEEGITIDHEEKCDKAECEILSDNACRLTIHEGKYHQVKRMFLAVNNEVLELKRIRMKNLVLDEALASGEYRRLTQEEIDGLKEPLNFS